MHQSLSDAAILIFANKQDVKGALSSAKVSDALGLVTLKDRQWHIQVCLTGLYSRQSATAVANCTPTPSPSHHRHVLPSLETGKLFRCTACSVTSGYLTKALACGI